MLTIAHLSLQSPLILAPLAGYSDLPFRQLCREYGAGLCVSEMISCHGLAYNQKKTITMLASTPTERPVSFQLFGADSDMMAKAADLLNNYEPDLVDINMGCPVKKVTKKGAGAALMAASELSESIIRNVVKYSEAPVTVKIRAGIDNTTLNCVSFAKMAEDAGASAVTVHGRTWSQGFKGVADWNHVLAVKKALTIPVIGNGDIQSYSEAHNRIRQKFCDGVMIGRGALGNPWAFHPEGRPDTLKDIVRGVLRHLELIQTHIDADRLLAAVKNHSGRYFKNIKGSSAIRKEVYSCKSFNDLYRYVLGLAADLGQ